MHVLCIPSVVVHGPPSFVHVLFVLLLELVPDEQIPPAAWPLIDVETWPMVSTSTLLIRDAPRRMAVPIRVV